MQRELDQHTRTERTEVGIAVAEISAAICGKRDLAVSLTGLSLRGPQEGNEEILCVIRGIDEAGLPVVSFHSGFVLGEVLRGVASRLNNGSLRWRPDELAR